MLSIAKLQNLKAIHNLLSYSIVNPLRCYQSQNYKIWKQFTTKYSSEVFYFMLLSIAKLQNLKAIHNCGRVALLIDDVVINRKTTKFESNSQLFLPNSAYLARCYQSQNYKIWKQFTTRAHVCRIKWQLLSIAKLQNLKAIHNAKAYHRLSNWVVINRKTTKFESNSQRLPLP